ncbi:MAG: phosphotransferase [Gemmatimonas sp.]|nr:phosphotransferase [Gemmatimonas sp.]
MVIPSTGALGRFAEAEVQEFVERSLASRFGPSIRIERQRQRPSAYGSSFPLEEVDVLLENGDHLPMLLKDVAPEALLESARRIKPAFLLEPLREIEVYLHLLAPRPHLGTARFYGAAVDPSRDRYWLLLERVNGIELYQVGELDVWRSVARWLAELHVELASDATSTATKAPDLVRYDREFFRQWMERARVFLRSRRPPLTADQWLRLDRLASRYDRVADRLLALPQTVIHGEFYASNILITDLDGRIRICPVDWEGAAIGPGLIDLAALSAGDWTEAQRLDLALAYRSALAPGSSRESINHFLEDLEYCRLHLAVQWLGWSPLWSPPAAHAYDWLGEAFRLADRIDI